MWAFALAASLTAGALCDELRVPIVPSVAGSSEPSLASLYEIGARALRERACLAPLSLEASLAAGLEAVIDRCGSDDACIEDALAAAGLRSTLFLIVVRTKNRWLLSVRWQERSRRTAVATETIDAENSALLERSIAPLLRRILDQAELERGGKLELTVAPTNARIHLLRDGEEIAFAGDRALPKGSYSLQVEADDHEPAERTIDLAPGQTITLHVALEEERSLFNEWWFWSAVGVAAAGTALAIGVAAQPGRSCLCFTTSRERCELICGGL